MNYLVVIGAALIPLFVGAVWYNPKVLGTAWINASGKTKEDLEGANMPVIFVLTIILGALLALAISQLTNHQSGVMQLFAMHPDFGTSGTEVQTLYDTIMDNYGDRHRTFGHGAVHGVIASVILVLPLLAITAMFERRGAKYIFIHWGYWLLTFVLMGGVICQWL
ncbi:MAG: DUF1761 domain-containing protein [Saprospiraceae bacterium]|nr:DUF1761 domain-containing protein [Bacteroidia bacterium]NNE13889.1 DUF1761 domain-containing protein [Saprospiraceae bacterium]NNL92042.1 DUF1761 domain-containing protein [Saprospiraceae bacterium]